jgi:hypothetical protein
MNPLFIFSIIISLCAPDNHICRWELCPYKGIERGQAVTAVTTYAMEACTDAYHIDMLHIQYPTLDADQLDSLLTQ